MNASLHGVSVIEKDSNSDALLVWSFPAVEKRLQQVLKSRSGLVDELNEAELEAFRFSKYRNSWLYQLSLPVKNLKAPKVVAVSIGLVASVFSPNKFQVLLKCLVADYMPDCSPIPVLASYLSVFTTGQLKASSTHEGYDDKAFDDRRALLAPVKDIFQMFGLDSIVIWTAVLLKKRVLVYAEKLSELLPVVRALPLLGAWHRQDFDILRPFVTLSELEVDDLSSAGVYIAGTVDRTAVTKKELYDLYLDVSSKSISIEENARADFAMTKLHKEIAQQFMESAENDNEQTVIKTIASKTKELTGNVASLKTEHEDGVYLTSEDLQQKKLPANMERFLFNVARAEKMTKQ